MTTLQIKSVHWDEQLPYGRFEQLEAMQDATDYPNATLSDGTFVFWDSETIYQKDLTQPEALELVKEMIDFEPKTMRAIKDTADAIVIVLHWLDAETSEKALSVKALTLTQ